MTGLEVLVALVIAVGLVGVIVPVLPGSLLVLGAVLVWALDIGSTTGWIVFAVATAFIALGNVVKYVVPGRRLKAERDPQLDAPARGHSRGRRVLRDPGHRTGGRFRPRGLPGRAEPRRRGASAWPATVHALKAVGLSILIELLATLCAAAAWVAGVVAT